MQPARNTRIRQVVSPGMIDEIFVSKSNRRSSVQKILRATPGNSVQPISHKESRNVNENDEGYNKFMMRHNLFIYISECALGTSMAPNMSLLIGP